MTVSVSELLNALPPDRDTWITIKDDQVVRDIVKEIVDAHKEFREHYDLIGGYFDGDTIRDVCDNIYTFLKRNIAYKAESKEDQTTAVPSGILTRQQGDCKHYASLSGGILDALNRMGSEIDWSYRFASYGADSTPHHVFVVVKDENGKDIWIDPTPGAKNTTPLWYMDKKIKKSSMPLRRQIAGLYEDDFELAESYNGSMSVDSSRPYGDQQLLQTTDDFAFDPDYYNPDTDDSKLKPELVEALELLHEYNILDANGNFNSALLYSMQDQLDTDMYERLVSASYYLDDQSKVSGFFSDLWRGVKKVTLAAPRGAYLALVALNVFGYATKLNQAMSTPEGFNKVRDKWYSLGGDLAKLQGSINAGKKRNKIFGVGQTVGTPAAVAAWVGVAGAIIAAIMPLIKEILNKQKGMNVPLTEGFDPSMFNDAALPNQSTGTDPMQWIKDHPAESAAIAVAAFLLLKKFKVIK